MAQQRESSIDVIRRQQAGWKESQRRKRPSSVLYGQPKLLSDRQRGSVSPLGGAAQRSQGKRST